MRRIFTLVAIVLVIVGRQHGMADDRITRAEPLFGKKPNVVFILTPPS